MSANLPEADATEPAVASRTPYRIELLGGYRYAFCACGLSKYQPFCDGSHTSTKTGIKPIIWTQEKDQAALLCGCKQSQRFPFCDASHLKL